MTSITTSISGTGSTASSTSAPATSMGAYNKLTEGDFMKLLTTQLANQDPTSPVDNTQMLAQLAQFSTLAAADTTNTDTTTTATTTDAAGADTPTATTETGTDTGLNDAGATSEATESEATETAGSGDESRAFRETPPRQT